MIDMLQNYLAGVLVIIGAAFSLVAAVGIVRLPDLYSRMHAASKAGTLGSGVMLLALAVYALSAHLLAKVAYLAGYRLWPGSVHDAMSQISDDAYGNGPKDANRFSDESDAQPRT